MNDQVESTGRLKSPPFPSIPLQKAVERAAQLYASERDHFVPVSSAARAWNMSPTSSAPIQTVGALKQYGLITDEGTGATRKVRLTHDALRIVLDKVPNSADRLRALERCFLAPKAFSELWQQYGKNLPSDQTVLNYLTLERKLTGLAPFSELGAIELLSNYLSTMAFVAPQGVQADDQSSDSVNIEDSPIASEAEVGKASAIRTASVPDTIPTAQTERVVFIEEGAPGQHIKLIASGIIDEFMLDALENYIQRQKRRLKKPEENK